VQAEVEEAVSKAAQMGSAEADLSAGLAAAAVEAAMSVPWCK
jgi:hypothetical protein